MPPARIGAALAILVRVQSLRADLARLTASPMPLQVAAKVTVLFAPVVASRLNVGPSLSNLVAVMPVAPSMMKKAKPPSCIRPWLMLATGPAANWKNGSLPAASA